MAQRVWPRNAAKERFWREVIGSHAKSGLSVKTYCSSRGVSEASFFAWRRELTRRDAESPQPAKVSERLAFQLPRHISRRKVTPVREAAPRWAQLQVMPGDSTHHGAMIEIVFPAGVRVCVAEGASRQTLADVVAVLEAPRC